MHLFRSLHHRNFRLFFAGQIVSLLGIWMQSTAVSWLTWRLTHSSAWLGAVGFASQIPVLVFGLLAGAVVDRTNRRRLIIGIQFTALVQAVILAGLTFSGEITALHIFLLSLALGFVFAFDYPTRQTFLMDMVGRDDISNAVALNASTVHLARSIGPAIAGIIAARWNEGMCFLINAVSFLPVIIGFFMMDKSELFPQEYEENHSIKASIKDGLRLAWRSPQIKLPIAIVGISSLAAMPAVVLLPQLVGVRFGGTARELGILMSAAGAGALVGSGVLAMWKRNLFKLSRWSLVLTGISLILLSSANKFWVAVPVLILMGFANLLVVAGSHASLQQAAPAASRGRVMSIFTVVFFGLASIGSLAAGAIASCIGVAWTIAAGGMICLVGPQLFSRKQCQNDYPDNNQGPVHGP